jgi:hypothetical protein
VRREREVRGFGGIRTAVEPNGEEFEDTIRELKAGPLHVGDTPSTL